MKEDEKDESVSEIEIIDEDTGAPKGNGPVTPTESDQLKAELEDQKRQNLYLRADFDNFRKQTIKERSDLLKYGSEPILREFLGVLDNLERAAQTEITPETTDTYKKGVQLIYDQFKKSLERFGVEELDPTGQPFDPTMHEALTSVDDPEKPANTITQVFKKAYKLNGKVIRPAQVVVNTGKKD
jgi:molecular chaperone GrpE